MGRAPCCDKANVKKGPWSPEEDAKLKEFIDKFGTGGNWIALPQKAGLKRCGKSCRLRWLNYLRPNIKHGEFSDEEDAVICALHATIGSRWSIIAAQLPGRTDNDIKNYWNTKLKKKLMAAAAASSSLLIPPSHSHSHLQPKFHLPFSSSGFQIPPQSHSHHFSTFHQLYTSIYNHPNTPSPSIAPPKSHYSFHLYSSNPNSNNTPPLPTFPTHSQFPPYFKDNMLVFGGNDQPASSSSDGSCGQISYGNIKQEEIGGIHHPHHHQGFISEDQMSNKLKFNMLDHDKNAVVDPIASFLLDHHHQNNSSSSSSAQLELQYELEEVKQLITSGDDINTFIADHHQVQQQQQHQRCDQGMYNYY